MIIRLLTFVGIKTGQRLPWRKAWRKSGFEVNRSFDLLYSLVLVAILLTSVALMSCTHIEPVDPGDTPTRFDIEAAQVMREMNGNHSGRPEY